MLRIVAPLVLLLAAAPVFAAEPCAHSAPRTLSLDLAGMRSVHFEVNHHELRVDARPGASAAVSGRACASDPAHLDQLTLSQRREGDTLVVRLLREGQGLTGLGGGHYAQLRLDATLPDTLPVRISVGSGDAWITGAASVEAEVASGDLDIRRIRGAVAAKVGSGDIDVADAGSLRVTSIGSGDLNARDIRGDVSVGSIGSGDFLVDRVAGKAVLDSIGSGDAGIRNATGAVELGSVGSGDFTVRGAASLRVRSIGSGDVDHSGVRGAVDLPRRR